MKTLYLTSNGAISFDAENNKAVGVNREHDRIQSVYLITEPTHVVYNVGTTEEELYAEPDDILVVFYNHESDYPHKIAIVKSAWFVDNIKSYREAEQKRKEEWALKNSKIEPQAECCCDVCETSCPA